MKRCPKCGGRVLCEQEIVASGWCQIMCWQCNYASKPMPFMWMAKIAWNRDKLRSETQK